MRKNKRKPAVIDLFCGAGGLSEGFHQAGYEILLGIDNIEIFMETFRKNHKKSISLCEDIKKISSKEIKEMIKGKKVDVVIGGPPCQGFSMAGRRDSKDPRNSLFMEFIKIIKELNPDFFVMENVRGILSMKTSKKKPVIDIIEKEFKKTGYKMKYRVLTSSDYGVPQKRQRVIFIGTNTGKEIDHPKPTHSKKPYRTLGGKKILPWVTVGKVLMNKKEIDKIFYHSQKMIDGFNKRKKKNSAKGYGFGAQFLKMDKPSYTISARYWKDGGDALVKYSDNEIRMLTPLECARIQSFPDTFKFAGSKRVIYTQIGNAVPPLLAKAIAMEIKKYIR